MERDLAHIKKDSLRYWFVDGLSEIVIGSLFLLVGAITLVQGLFEPGSFIYGFSALLVFLVIAAGTPLSRKLIKYLKERITYPRTGYIAYKAPTSVQRTVSMISGILTALIVLLLVFAIPQISIALLPLILGFLLAGFLFLIGLRAAVIRYRLIATGMVIIGFLLSLFARAEWLSVGILLTSLGLLLLLSGFIVLSGYLRGTHHSQEVSLGS